MEEENKNEIEPKKSLIDIKALIISIIIVLIIVLTFVFFITRSNEDTNNVDEGLPKGCVKCEKGSGICCPLIVESSLQDEELTELEIKLGCVKCDSFSGKCCPIKDSYIETIEDGCIACSLDGEMCCPIDMDLTEEEIERGCYKTEEKGVVYCPR